METPPSPPGASSQPPGPGPNFRLGEYIIRKTLGHGAMGTVYLAHDSTGHEVALKLFLEGPGVSATMLERFRREAEAAKKLRRHPNIMKVYATGQQGPYHFIIMEPVHHSRTFDDVIAAGPSDINAAVTTIIKIARALQFAHQHSIIHRDVKPGNIMMDEFGEPLLTDFGVAAMNDWPGCTITGALTGTPLYMSPEQARSERVGPESDIYSLGVVLYEVLTGVLPYSAQHASPVKAVLEAVKNEMPPRPRSLRKEITPELEAIMMKALAKKPEDRYADADSFARDLELALAGHHVHAHLFSFRDRVAFLLNRHRDTAIAIAAVLLVAAGFWIYFQSRLREAQYEHLLTTAHLKSAALSGPRSIERELSPQDVVAATAQQEWFAAMRAIHQGQYLNASIHLGAAIDLSRETGDARTMARAQKEYARILTLENRPGEAMELYRLVIDNQDAPAAEIHQARLEALLLALLNDRRDDAIELLGRNTRSGGNIFRDAKLCLTGEISAEAYRDQIAFLPGRLQNDAHLVVAIRYRIDGNERAYRRELQQTIRASSPAHEWPAPLARQLFEQGGRR